MRWSVFLALAILSTLVPHGAGSPSPAPPLSPGTTWTYRYTIARASEAPQTGTFKIVFGGPTAFRGATYYYMDQSGTLEPGVVERAYLAWTRGTLRQVASVASDAQNNLLEILFDKSVPTGPTQEVLAGSAQVFENGTLQGKVPWRAAASRQGPVNVTVPAGTFRAMRWSIEFTLGQVRQVSSIHTVGFADVRIDTKIFTSGSAAGSILRELVSGPVR